jgi:hypothetical protein
LGPRRRPGCGKYLGMDGWMDAWKGGSFVLTFFTVCVIRWGFGVVPLAGRLAGREAGWQTGSHVWLVVGNLCHHICPNERTNERTLKETLHSPNSTRWWTTARSALCVCLFCARLLDTYIHKQTNKHIRTCTHAHHGKSTCLGECGKNTGLRDNKGPTPKKRKTHTQAHISVEYECGGLVMGFWPATPQPGGGAIPRRRAEGARARIL